MFSNIKSSSISYDLDKSSHSKEYCTRSKYNVSVENTVVA